MSEASVVSDRFWSEFRPDVAGTLSVEQRREIERVVGSSTYSADTNSDLSDIRLSFGWFFVRLIWGAEKRNPNRVKKDQKENSPMAKRNLPMLASIFTGYAFFLLLFLTATTLLFTTYIV